MTLLKLASVPPLLQPWPEFSRYLDLAVILGARELPAGVDLVFRMLVNGRWFGVTMLPQDARALRGGFGDDVSKWAGRKVEIHEGGNVVYDAIELDHVAETMRFETTSRPPNSR